MGAEAFAIAELASNLAGAYGTYQAGKQEKMAANSNAGLLEQQAEAIRAQGPIMRYEGERQLRRDLGTATADAVSGGVTADTGSPLINEINTASDAYFNMAIEQWNIDIAARAYENKANMVRWEGKMAEKGAKRKAITSAVGSLASFGYSQIGGTKTIGGDTNGGKGTMLATTGNTRSGTVYGVRHG